MDLLEPLGSECLYLNTGWWTYKFCYLKEISQFHREAVAVPASPAAAAQAQARAAATAKVPPPKTGARSAAEAAANIAEHKAAVDAAMAAAGGGTAATAASAATPAPPMSARMQITAEFLLGRLPLDAPAESLEQLARTRVVQGASWEDSYVSQHYEDGTLCDLSGRPRQAETRLYCSPEGDGETGTNSLGAIRAVTESSTCQYIVTIATPLLCAHPLFRPRVPSLLEIACTPIDDDEGAAALTAAISSSSSSSSSRTPSTGTLKHQRVSSGDTKMLLINAHGDARAVP
jgi:protein OS-9